MARRWQIVTLAFLLLALLANAGLLWLYGNVAPEVAGLRAAATQRAGEAQALLREQDRLRQQLSSLEQEKDALEAEKGRLQEELTTLQGQSDFLERLDQLEAQSRALRRLVPQQSVPRSFVSPEELRASLEADLASSRPRIALKAQTLVALGLLAPGTNLYNLLLDLYTEQVIGYYDTTEDVILLVGKEMDPLEQLTFVHEYTHALQDQAFDLGAQEAALQDDSDRLLALYALAEGDAMLAMQQYLLAHPDLLSPELVGRVLGTETAHFDAAPAVVQQELLFPYEAGLAFVLPLYDERGWAGVNAAWADPPQSTEQVLHPERYPDDAPQVVEILPLTATLGAGWRFQGEDTLGEFLLRQHLTLHLDADQVERAATGWDGDRYALYTCPDRGDICLAVHILWDDEDEAAEFAALYRAFGEARYGAPGEGSLSEGMWWAGGPGLYLRQRGDKVWLVLTAERGLAEVVARKMR